jgi:spermidine synthase
MRRRSILLVLFALSGAAGLAYETLWFRSLVLIFGSTVVALGTILAAFLGGLAAGSLVIGHRTTRWERPLRLYGLLEVGIGAAALILPFILRGIQSLTMGLFAGDAAASGVFAVVRFVLVFIALLVPTFLMGGTLPAMMRHFVRRESDVGREAGMLYFANTAGAVAGTVLTGFVLIPSLGMARTNFVAVACNLLVGAAVLALERRTVSDAEPDVAAVRTAIEGSPAAGDLAPISTQAPAEEAPLPPVGASGAPVSARAPHAILIYTAYAIVGFAALALEVFWTRSLLLTLGTTVYAFATMLSTYLLGLALGGLAGARIASRTRHPARALALLVGAAGLAVLIGNRYLGTLPLRYLRLQLGLGLDWNASIIAKFLLAFLIMIPATFFLGAAFPVALRAAGAAARTSGAAVGRLYAANTAGSILGSLLAGLVLIPLLGLERGLVVMALLFLAVSLALLALARSRAAVPLAILYAAALAVSLAFPSWDRYLQRSGVYFYASHYQEIDAFLRARRDYTILSYQEGPEATVAVVDGQRYRYLQINGKTDASTGKDMITQVTSAHLPMLFHSNPKSVLVIGLGSGVTIGSVARHPVDRIECLEIAPEVIDAAQLFTEANGAALEDPRLTMTIGDGRNFLQQTRERFDVIISEPSNPWIAGIGALFTREFLALAKSRLAPGGVMCQWTNLYDLSESDLAIMLATYREAFPNGAVFLSHLGDLLLIGTDGPPRLNFNDLIARISDPRIQADLTRIGVSRIYDLLGSYICTFDGLSPLVPAGTPLHTDDRAQLEFSAPKNLYKDFTLVHLTKILSIHQPILPLLEGMPAGEEGTIVARAVTEGVAARHFFLQAVLQSRSGDIRTAVESARQAHRLAPAERNIAETLSEYLSDEGQALEAAGDLDGAIARYLEAMEASPEDPRFAYYYGMAASKRDPNEAIRVLGEVVRADSKLREARIGLASALSQVGRHREARFQLGLLVDQRPDDSAALRMRGDVSALEGDFAAAMQDFLRAVEVDPNDREARAKLAFTYAQTGRTDLALAQYKRLYEQAPEDVPTLFNLATLTTQAGDHKEAIRLWERLVQMEPSNEEFQRNLSALREGRVPAS